TIVRTIIERKAPLEFEGSRYQIPYKGPGSTGQGKKLKSILHGRPDIPIYVGALAPKAQAQAGELADGLLLTAFNPYKPAYVIDNLHRGFDKREGARDFSHFDVAVSVPVVMSDELEEAMAPLKQQLGFYIGAMGCRTKSFSKDFLAQSGF